jgi:hypothetical protein
MHSLRRLLPALGFALLTTTAQAYRTDTCDIGILGSADIKFPSNTATVRYSATSFPAGARLDALVNGFSQFNKNPSNFRLSQAVATAATELGNGRNDIWGSTSQQILDGAPAIAYSWTECYWFFGVVAKVNESDVIFDYTSTASNPFEWVFSRAKSGVWNYGVSSGNSTGRLLQTTQLHELGHLAGLQHESRYYNVMGADFEHLDTNSSNVNAYMGEDAATGLVALYGVRSSYGQDLAVAHWRRTGATGEYSRHSRTRIFNTSGTELSKVNVGGEPRYNVTRGASVRVELTYENLGRTSQSNVPIRFYISTNDVITTSDTQIASTTISSLGRGLPDLLQHTVTVPSSLAATTDYWLGVIVDPVSTISDADRNNNTSYIRIRTN